MASKAQIKASNKYNKDKTLTICLRLNKETDKDIIEILDSKDNKTGYIKNLISPTFLTISIRNSGIVGVYNRKYLKFQD